MTARERQREADGGLHLIGLLFPASVFIVIINTTLSLFTPPLTFQVILFCPPGHPPRPSLSRSVGCVTGTLSFCVVSNIALRPRSLLLVFY